MSGRRAPVLVPALAALLALVPAAARAHDFRPALLALTEERPVGDEVPQGAPVGEKFAVVWRLPLEAGSGSLRPQFAEGTLVIGVPMRSREGDMLVQRFGVQRQGGLAGTELRIQGQAAAVSEVLVRVEFQDGRLVTGRVTPGPRGESFAIPAVPTHAGVARTYLRLGVEHILTGLDHLAFVLLLVLLSGSAGTILRAVTAFTAAHSITLALAALGLARVPQPPVEATIALSIMFAARELSLRRSGVPAGRAPTAMAFGFGLLHGLGFAGALAEVGLPSGDIPVSLFCFNLGVELGQLGFVLVVLLLRRLAALIRARFAAEAPWRAGAFARHLPALGIGSLGGFWLIERVLGFFG